MPNTIGYARVSTEDQTVALQEDALLGAGCARVFSETGSGKSIKNRDQLQAALGYLNPADTLAVWRLDRLGRSVRDLIDLVDGLQQRGIEFRSLTESIDTGTSGGRLIFHVFAALVMCSRRFVHLFRAEG